MNIKINSVSRFGLSLPGLEYDPVVKSCDDGKKRERMQVCQELFAVELCGLNFKCK
jgi:hypothetical protein